MDAKDRDARKEPVGPADVAPSDAEPSGADGGGRPDEPLELTVGGAVPGGRCLARVEGKVVLVAGALPGERVRVRLTRDEKRWAEAEAVEILEPSAGRRRPPCAHADECGGCDLQHAEPALQREMKRQIVLDAFRRIGGLDVGDLLEGPDDHGDEMGVRNRIRLSFDPTGRVGLRRRGTHDVVPIDDCPLMRAPFREDFLPWARLLPPWRRATVRIDSRDRMVVLFETGDPPNEKDRRRYGKITRGMERPESIVGFLADGIPLGGERNLHFRVREADLRADATSFFQVSTPGTDRLVDTVEACLGGERRGTLLDLYAGVGLFSVCLGRGWSRVVAGEADARAARHLKRNLRRNGVRGEARAESALETLLAVPRIGPETVICDPPRAGLSKEVRRALVRRAPERIVSVSCDPSTAARDVKHLTDTGWRLNRLVAIDLFPQTAHVETVAELGRDDDAGPGPGAGSPG
jgi:tRNA/tmRNA/rRNA uracil-C5-methylase (TrmA/RlmC/RlmD family)